MATVELLCVREGERRRTRGMQSEGNASDVCDVVERAVGTGNRYEAKEIRTRKKHSSQWILISFFFHFFSFASFSVFNHNWQRSLIWCCFNMFRFGIPFSQPFAFCPWGMRAVQACGSPEISNDRNEISSLMFSMLLVCPPIHKEFLSGVYSFFFSLSIRYYN